MGMSRYEIERRLEEIDAATWCIPGSGKQPLTATELEALLNESKTLTLAYYAMEEAAEAAFNKRYSHLPVEDRPDFDSASW